MLLPLALPHLFSGIRRASCNIVLHGVPGTGGWVAAGGGGCSVGLGWRECVGAAHAA